MSRNESCTQAYSNRPTMLVPVPRGEGQPITVELCNDCDGLVGWTNLREGCCPGGVVCKSEAGTRFVPLLVTGDESC